MRSDGSIEKKRKMVFPGTYDPFTKGHLNVVERAILLCDELVIAVFDNSHKTTVVPIEKRVEWIRKALADYPAVKVLAADGLLVHFCEKHGIDTIVRGVRGPVQFEEEIQMAEINRMLDVRVETIFLPSYSSYRNLSSSLVREIARLGESVASFIPEAILDEVASLYGVSDGGNEHE